MNWLVHAHPGQPLSPHDLWSAWSAEPSILLPLVLTGLVYLWGVRSVWRRAGAGHGIGRAQLAGFLGALLALAAALLSPLDALSSSLFSVHMLQHLVLILVAAPLLALSDLPLALLWALPRRQAQMVGNRFRQARTLAPTWKLLAHPITAWLLFTAVMWVWHTPALYEAALRDESIHAVEHLFFLVSAVLFWWVLFQHTRPGAIRFGTALPYLFTTLLQSGILGALITFTTRPWYRYYTPEVTAPWGLTPLEDQQLAGVIMWVPVGLVFTLLIIGLFAVWLRALERRDAGY